MVAVDADGKVIGTWGEQDITFFYRSAIKPFQATVSREAGADLPPEQMAVTCSSHGGYPLHLGLVEANLARQVSPPLLCSVRPHGRGTRRPKTS